MQASWYNTPLPRMRRQPPKIAAMQYQRRTVRHRRAERGHELMEWRRHIATERKFETLLEVPKNQVVFNGPDQIPVWSTCFDPRTTETGQQTG
jgi:hypothetical protein